MGKTDLTPSGGCQRKLLNWSIEPKPIASILPRVHFTTLAIAQITIECWVLSILYTSGHPHEVFNSSVRIEKYICSVTPSK